MSLNLHLLLTCGPKRVDVDLRQTPTEVTVRILERRGERNGKEPCFQRYLDWITSCDPNAGKVTPEARMVAEYRRTAKLLREQGATEVAEAYERDANEWEGDGIGLSQTEQESRRLERTAQALADEAKSSLEAVGWTWACY